MIEVFDLYKHYGRVEALAGFSFAANPGQIVGLIGPNGAGKSTLMRVLCGYLSPSSGRASVGHFDVTRESLQVRRILGYLPENSGLYAEMRVSEYLRHRAALKHIPASARGERVHAVVSQCGLKSMYRRLIGQLSKGYRQRVGLAAVLLSNPEVLILDEPTAGLDPLQLGEIRDLIRQLGQDRTVLFSSHVLSEVETLCDRIVLIDKGRKLLDTETRALGEHAEESYLKLEFLPPAQPVLCALEKIPALKIEVLSENPTVRLKLVSLQKPFDVERRLEISKTLMDNRKQVLEFSLQEANLDDVFSCITREANLP